MIRLMRKIKAQSILEYSMLVIIVMAVLLAMSNYVKRGVQGRWKASVDDMGDQYDPWRTNMLQNYVLISASNTMVDIVPSVNGSWTRRVDTANTTETKGGVTSVGPP